MIVEIVDALRDLLPSDEAVTPDDTATEPYKVLPGRLYVWPRRIAPNQLNLDAEAEGFFDDSVLRLRILYALPSKGEPRVKRADRGLTEALDTATAAIIAALWANRRYPAGSGSLWWHLNIESVSPDAVRTFEVRAYGIDVALRLSPSFGSVSSGGAS